MQKLTTEQLRDFALGVDELEPGDGFVRLHRMSPPLRAHYSRTESSLVRMVCTAGCRVRFRSDTGSLTLALRFARSARPFFRSTLVLDHPIGGTARATLEQWADDATDRLVALFTGDTSLR